MAHHPVILADNITTTTTGPAVGLRGERIQLGSSSTTQQQRYTIPIEVYIKVSGAVGNTATVKVYTGPTATPSLQFGSDFIVTIGADGQAKGSFLVGVLPSTADYIRLSVTAVTGCAINAYVIRKG